MKMPVANVAPRAIWVIAWTKEDEPLLANAKQNWFDCSKIDLEQEEFTGDVADTNEELALLWLQEASEDEVVRLMCRLLAARPQLETSLLTSIHTAQLALRSLERKSTFFPSTAAPCWAEEVHEDHVDELPRRRGAKACF